jgi:heptaprenyl diphosphate synthase
VKQPGTSAKRIVLISMLSACGLVFFVFESFLPLLPWFRPGLGNIATIVALFALGSGDALKVTVLRITLGALVLGRLFTPVFVMAIAGGLVSVLVMSAFKRYSGNIFGPVGISVLGAVSHNAAQIAAAYLLFVKSPQIFAVMPVFTAAGVITGTLTGILSFMIIERLGERIRISSV